MSARGTRAQIGRRQREDLPDGVIECPHAGKTRGEGDVTHRNRTGLDQQPRGLGPLSSCQRQRASAQLGEQLPLDLPDAVPQPRGQARDTVAIDHPIGESEHEILYTAEEVEKELVAAGFDVRRLGVQRDPASEAANRER